MSSRHCHVSLENERVILTDMGSRNGTFIQVKGETAVSIGDFLLIGKQLLQVQPHQSEAQAHISI
jgi:pSer/pThr/pTyr-binding forkhead associated (FHA) protein